MKSIGIIEVVGNVASIETLDAMLKVADVELVTTEKALGGRLVSIIVEGSVSNVKEAIEHGKVAAAKLGRVAAHVVIPNPHQEVKRLVDYSSRKLTK